MACRHVLVLSLLFVKEDLALVVAAFGIYAVIIGRRRLGAVLFVVGIASFGLLTDVVVPALAVGGVYPHWSYQELGSGPGVGLRGGPPTNHPSPDGHPASKGRPLGVDIPARGALPLLSPIVILAVPELLERLLSQRESVWQTNFQYGRAASSHSRPGSHRRAPAWGTLACR